MGFHTRPPTTRYTLPIEQYRALENAGHITRPITDEPIGTHTTHRRTEDATNSHHVTPRPRKQAA